VHNWLYAHGKKGYQVGSNDAIFRLTKSNYIKVVTNEMGWFSDK
jgi:hypothetical protein